MILDDKKIIHNVISGNTFNGIVYKLRRNGAPMDLTGCKAVFTAKPINPIKTTTYNLPIVIKDALLGQMEIQKQIINWIADDYKFEITFTLFNGDVLTMIRGIFKVQAKI